MRRDYVPWLIALLLASSLAFAAPVVQIAGTGPWGNNTPVIGVPMGATDPSGKLQQVKVNASNEVLVSCAGCSGGGGGAVTQSGTWTVGLSAGTNNIGDVDVLTLPAVTGSVSVSNFPATQPVSGSVSVSNFPATQPVSLVTLPALVAGTSNIGDVDVLTLPAITGTVSVSNFPATQPVSGSVSISNFPATQPVSLAALPSLVAGTANIGDVDVLTLPAVTGTVGVNNFPSNQNVTCTSGCASPSAQSIDSKILAATTNATVVKNAAGSVHTLAFSNNGTVIAYLKLYNKATTPTCGTDVPVQRYQIPATAAGPWVIRFDGGVAFSNGIGYCVVTGIADNSTAAVVASAYLVTVGFK